MTTAKESGTLGTDELFSQVAADRALRREQLAQLISYQSLAFPGYDPKQSEECAQTVADMLRELGFADVEMLDVGGVNPTAWAETRPYKDAPTVLLYAHYDVQPAPLEQGWDSDPWTMVECDNRLYGRGAADDKAGIVQHLSALRALLKCHAAAGMDSSDSSLDSESGCNGELDSKDSVHLMDVNSLPFNIKVCFEGEEEYGDSLPRYISTDPQRFKADVFLVCDGGNLEIGKPLLQTTLRGIAEQTITLRTLPNALHSGAFGGPAPDAFLALTKLAQSLYDKDGNTVIEGVKSGDYEGSVDYSEELFRKQAEMSDDVQLVGTGSIASRLWARPAIKVVGVDMAAVETSSNVVTPEVRARLSLRFPAGQEGADVLQALQNHLRKHVPWGAELVFGESVFMNAFAANAAGGPLTELMKQCLTEAFGQPCSEGGSGGSIPLVEALQSHNEDAEFLLFGPIDSERANMHGANESVCEFELERSTKAEALFLSRLI